MAAGGDLQAQSLMLAYRSGIFPWPHPGLPLLWFCPPKRAVLEFKDIKEKREFKVLVSKELLA